MTPARLTGHQFTIVNSAVFNGDTVTVVEVSSAAGTPVGNCLRCGRPLRRRYWRVICQHDGTSYGEIGPDCVEHLS